MSRSLRRLIVRLALLAVFVALLTLGSASLRTTPAIADVPYRIYLPLLAYAQRELPPPDAIGRIGKPWQFYDASEAVPGQLLVRWRDGVDIDTIARINSSFSVMSVGHIAGIGVQILQVAPDLNLDLLSVYNSLPEVEYAEPNFIAYAQPVERVGPAMTREEVWPNATSVNDPQANQQYSLSKMQVYDAWDVTKGDGVVIAVLDTGYDFTHPDLQGKYVSRGKDFINRDDDATDDQGHGTHVAGIAAGLTNNGVGIAGVGYNAKILPGKVLGANGSGDFGAIANGITWAADQGVKVINMSLGGAYGSATLENAVNYAWNKGVVVVCAAGNSSTSTPHYPAGYTNCISIIATDANDKRGSFSNYGSSADLSAPGVAILSTVRGGRYESWNGTSMASPNAAGVAALVAAAHPDWTNAQIRAALENTADNIGSAFDYGKGRVNAARAVSSGPVTPPTPGPSPTNRPNATTVPSPSPTTAPSNDYELETIRLINVQRASNGLPALEIDSRLMDAADFHNRWMLDNNCFNHQCPGEPDPFQRMRNAGYPLLSGSENIGNGYQRPSDMVTGWMNSSGHKANILGNWAHIGCGFLQGPSGSYTQRYWTCNFARPSGSAPTFTPTRAPNQATSTPTPVGANPSRTPTPRATTPPSQAEWARRTLDEINRIRAERGLPAAGGHVILQRVAQGYSQ